MEYGLMGKLILEKYGVRIKGKEAPPKMKGTVTMNRN
jgi:hypothetical protein